MEKSGRWKTNDDGNDDGEQKPYRMSRNSLEYADQQIGRSACDSPRVWVSLISVEARRLLLTYLFSVVAGESDFNLGLYASPRMVSFPASYSSSSQSFSLKKIHG